MSRTHRNIEWLTELDGSVYAETRARKWVSKYSWRNFEPSFEEDVAYYKRLHLRYKTGKYKRRHTGGLKLLKKAGSRNCRRYYQTNLRLAMHLEEHDFVHYQENKVWADRWSFF